MGDSGFLIVGLGNPGEKYALTRHNAGFLALDFFADEQGLFFNTTKWQALFSRSRYAGNPLLLVKPQTYMNRSGEAVASFADFYRISPAKILVVHDDLDLAPGKIKVVARGGAGGHNGIRSIISHLGTSDFARLKIGIGRPSRNEKGQGVPVDRYVLATFSSDERDLLQSTLGQVAEAMDLFASKGVDHCMNRINGR
jgi:PTH1 family peptidyl-tRNA hydrolase